MSYNPLPTATSPAMSPLLTPTIPRIDPSKPDQYPPTLLFRVYGPSSGALISRTEELRILHVLSTQYGLGPKVYGTFDNGRVEQFFPSRALTAAELRDPAVSRGIAKRMRELHSVDLKALGYRSAEPMVWRCLREWAALAEDVLVALERAGSPLDFSLHSVREEMERYRSWVQAQGPGGVVFAREAL